MEFLDIPLFDDDFIKMMFRFVINFAFHLLRFFVHRSFGIKNVLECANWGRHVRGGEKITH